jgi:hypothetical protein|tara:strand:- start:1112 stop:1372 length:261 start_codon:yes stop_codon:yes gene_type:complete
MATQNKFVVEYGLSVGTTEVISSSGKIVAAALTNIDTDDISEGSTNEYFTDGRARQSISLASGETNLSYDNSNGQLSLPTLDGGTI